MGSYGIGVSRLVAAIIEAKFNNNVMKWPLSVAPYEIVIIPMIKKNDNANLKKAESLYKELRKNNIDVLLDDTDESLSAKLKKFELIGVPYQVIVGEKSKKDIFEFKEIDKESENLTIAKIVNKVISEKKRIDL